MSIIRELLTPESHRDGYTWAVVAAAHCWLGLGIWGGIAVIWDRWTGVYAAPVVYFLLVEAVQLVLTASRTRQIVWDSILDTVSVAFGCVAAAFVGDGNLNGAMAAWGASMGVIAVGWMVRDR